MFKRIKNIFKSPKMLSIDPDKVKTLKDLKTVMEIHLRSIKEDSPNIEKYRKYLKETEDNDTTSTKH